MYSKPPQYPENPFWAHKAACPATVFFFPRLAGQDRLAYSVLVLLLFDCFFTEQLITAGVDPKTAEADACRIEHIISDESFDRLKEAVEQEQD